MRRIDDLDRQIRLGVAVDIALDDLTCGRPVRSQLAGGTGEHGGWRDTAVYVDVVERVVAGWVSSKLTVRVGER